MNSTHLTLLLLIALSIWRDREALRGGGAVNRFAFYTVMAASFLILLYNFGVSDSFHPADWLGRLLEPLVRFSRT
ncbi:hypothetical protein [Paenibacillus phocaensis]|uniref:hypothetical protein n=1 Tax=Paenibacillus phocaensis TaxID=1776378 RepID=UPI000839BCAE|nr:hypothetical protein [Paenibacillus phocaensis]